MRPQHEDRSSLDSVVRDNRVVARQHSGIPETQYFPLHFVGLPWINAFRREHRVSVLVLNTQHHITAAKIVKVIGKRANGVQYLHWIPIGPILNAFTVDPPLPQQAVNFDGKFCFH